MISSAYSSSLSKLSNRRSSTNIRFNVRRSASRKGEK